MNAPVSATSFKFLSAEMLASARASAANHEHDGRVGTAVMILSLAFDIEKYRELLKHAGSIINDAGRELALAQSAATDAKRDALFAQLKASTLLISVEKVCAAIERKDWASLESLSDELHAAMRLVRG